MNFIDDIAKFRCGRPVGGGEIAVRSRLDTTLRERDAKALEDSFLELERLCKEQRRG